jgi:hypothetical protein
VRQAVYGDQLAKKLPQFIGSSHLLGNPIGVVRPLLMPPLLHATHGGQHFMPASR